ncbi:MAG: hypothetical protein JWM44_3400 [Bacilli bacterium]|nr:hypothetical protein [Bacilli bacterium]
MLRHLFDEPKRQDSGLLLQANQALRQYLDQLQHVKNKEPLQTEKLRRWEIWVQSFITAVDELEQSVYCSSKYSERIAGNYIEQMGPEEQANYHRYLYFYKNSFIRVFAILDKLGYFLNERLQLNTEKVKPRFSYFTVLRQMHERHIQSAMEQRLYDLKVKYSEALDKLREQRNVEIHSINYEAADDLFHSAQAVAFSWNHIENLPQNKKYLQSGFEMVCLTIVTIFSSAYQMDPRG